MAASEHLEPYGQVYSKQLMLDRKSKKKTKQVLPEVPTVGEEEEPPRVGGVGAEGEVAAAVARACVTVLASLACERSKENGFRSENEKRDRFQLECLYVHAQVIHVVQAYEYYSYIL